MTQISADENRQEFQVPLRRLCLSASICEICGPKLANFRGNQPSTCHRTASLVPFQRRLRELQNRCKCL